MTDTARPRLAAPVLYPRPSGAHQDFRRCKFADRPRSVRFPQGRYYGNWEVLALEGNDLGGLRRKPSLDCRSCRRGLPHTAFPETAPLVEGLPEEKPVYGTSRFGILCGFDFVGRRWLVGC